MYQRQTHFSPRGLQPMRLLLPSPRRTRSGFRPPLRLRSVLLRRTGQRLDSFHGPCSDDFRMMSFIHWVLPLPWYCLSLAHRGRNCNKAVQPTCSHGSGWRCFWLPDRLRAVSWNQRVTARCRAVQAELPHSNPGGPTKFLKDLQPGISSKPLFLSPLGVHFGRQAGCAGSPHLMGAELPLTDLKNTIP
jgi:hypothetical protein